MHNTYFKGIFLFCFFPTLCSAQIFSYVTKSTGIPTNARYEYVIESWDMDDTTPNPCFQKHTCAVGINHRHTHANTAGSTDVSPSKSVVGTATHPQITKLQTMGELSRYYQRVYPLPIVGSTSHQGDAITEECVGLFYTTTSGSVVENDHAYLMPGSICGIAPPPVGKCSIDEHHLDLNHGTLHEKELDGNTAYGNLRVVCTQKMNIVMYTLTGSNSHLELGNNSGVYSTLRINGTLGHKGYPFTVDTTGALLSLTSTIGVNGKVNVGSYSGQTVAIIAMP